MEDEKDFSVNLYLQFKKQSKYDEGEIFTLGCTLHTSLKIKVLIQKRKELVVILRDSWDYTKEIKLKLDEDTIKNRIYLVFQFKKYKKGIKTELYVNNKLRKKKRIRKFYITHSLSNTSVVYGGVMKNAFPYILYTGLVYHKFLDKIRVNELYEYFNKEKNESSGLSLTRNKLIRLPERTTNKYPKRRCK